MTMSVIKVSSGGLAVSKATTPYGYPCILSTNGLGIGITVVALGGLPIADATVGGGIFSGIQLSNATFNANSLQGTPIGVLSAVGGSGTYVFSLTDSAGSKVQVAGTNGVNLQAGVAASTPSSFSITVTTTGGTPNFTQTFLITALPILPANSGGANLPVISGSTVVGNVLTATTGSWTGSATITYSYQWKRGATNIGSNANTYTTTVADIGSTITVIVTATNAAGSANATSAATTAISGAAPVNSGGANLPVISGTTQVGSTLTTSNGTWTGTPSPAFTYLWYKDGLSTGVTLGSYLLSSTDLGSTITVVVTGTNIVGSSSATSTGVGPITNPVVGTTPTYYVYFF